MRIFDARVTALDAATPSIRALRLAIDDPAFRFLPGQWVDLSVEVDGEVQTSGYSITSSPLHGGEIELAIKASSKHPVARWVHERAAAGDTVRVTQGQGPFVYLPEMSENLVLIGGGVGVTPLLSIFRYVRDASPETHATLYYSVSHPDEILFREELEQAARRHNNLSLEITVTQPCADWKGQTGRINKHKLSALNAAPEALFYLCGPAGMVDDMEKLLRELGVPPNRVIFEKWW